MMVWPLKLLTVTCDNSLLFHHLLPAGSDDLELITCGGEAPMIANSRVELHWRGRNIVALYFCLHGFHFTPFFSIFELECMASNEWPETTLPACEGMGHVSISFTLGIRIDT